MRSYRPVKRKKGNSSVKKKKGNGSTWKEGLVTAIRLLRLTWGLSSSCSGGSALPQFSWPVSRPSVKLSPLSFTTSLSLSFSIYTYECGGYINIFSSALFGLFPLISFFSFFSCAHNCRVSAVVHLPRSLYLFDWETFKVKLFTREMVRVEDQCRAFDSSQRKLYTTEPGSSLI